jgi:predicted lipid carrier protein YhbT
VDRLLTADHVIKVKKEGAEISQATICASNPHAPVVAGFDSGKFNLKIQDKPALELFSSDSLKQAREHFRDYARFLLPGVMLQIAFRLALMTRETRLTVLEIADAAIQWVIESQHDAGRLSDRFEGRKKTGRAQSVLSSDQEMRAQSIMAAFMRIVTSMGVDVNLSGEGTKMVELLFARVRQAVGNHDTDTLFISRMSRQLLDDVHEPTGRPRITDPAKHSPVGGGIVFAANRQGSIDLPVEPRKVRAWVFAFMKEQISDLDGWLDIFHDAIQKVD